MFKKSPQTNPLDARILAFSNTGAQTLTAEPATKRAAVRTPTFRHGDIILDGGEVISVVVKNASDTGLRIDTIRALDLPRYVMFRGGARSIPRKARVVRQERHSAALVFVD